MYMSGVTKAKVGINTGLELN